MQEERLQAAAEAVLFASGEPLPISRLADALELSIPDAQKILNRLAQALDDRGSGVCLKQLGDRYQLCTRVEYAEEVRSVLESRRNTPLSQASFEVLAVVAYNQPVTKAFVEQVRGVDCSGVISTLCQKGLIEERGRLDLPGKPIVYGTTPAFLRCFCISSLEELPPLPQSGEPAESEEPASANDAENESNEMGGVVF